MSMRPVGRSPSRPALSQRASDTAAVAMLDCGDGHPRIVSDTVLSALAEALIDAGDVQCV